MGWCLIVVSPRRRGIPSQLTNLWTVASREQFYTDFIILTSENQGDRDAKAKRPGFQFNFQKDAHPACPQTAPNQRRAKGKHMRFQDAPLMLKPRNPCPVCSAETALAEIEPHPLHANFEIHGYFCDRCGPIVKGLDASYVGTTEGAAGSRGRGGQAGAVRSDVVDNVGSGFNRRSCDLTPFACAGSARFDLSGYCCPAARPWSRRYRKVPFAALSATCSTA